MDAVVYNVVDGRFAKISLAGFACFLEKLGVNCDSFLTLQYSIPLTLHCILEDGYNRFVTISGLLHEWCPLLVSEQYAHNKGQSSMIMGVPNQQLTTVELVLAGTSLCWHDQPCSLSFSNPKHMLHI